MRKKLLSTLEPSVSIFELIGLKVKFKRTTEIVRSRHSTIDVCVANKLKLR